ncbi:MAG TPA: hypothetical protein VNN07_14575 [Candidatus Tectomicrobia bacterium]|nr:hypothetical protein [Candidatus Tectomicrobia bacterium]
MPIDWFCALCLRDLLASAAIIFLGGRNAVHPACYFRQLERERAESSVEKTAG